MQWSVPDWNLWKVAINGGINGLARSGRLLERSVFMEDGAGRHDFNRI